MHLRNRHLADESSYCLCYLTSARGGTKYTVDYCMAHGVKVCNLALGDLSSDCFSRRKRGLTGAGSRRCAKEARAFCFL